MFGLTMKTKAKVLLRRKKSTYVIMVAYLRFFPSSVIPTPNVRQGRLASQHNVSVAHYVREMGCTFGRA